MVYINNRYIYSYSTGILNRVSLKITLLKEIINHCFKFQYIHQEYSIRREKCFNFVLFFYNIRPNFPQDCLSNAIIYFANIINMRVTENYLMYFIFSLASRILYYKPAGIYIVKYGQ